MKKNKCDCGKCDGVDMTVEDKEFNDMIETHILGIPARLGANGVFLLDADVQAFLGKGGTVDQIHEETDIMRRKVKKLLVRDEIDNTTDKMAQIIANKVSDMLAVEFENEVPDRAEMN